jgi:hypothetical protein
MGFVFNRKIFATLVARSKHLATELSVFTLKVRFSLLRSLREHSAPACTATVFGNARFTELDHSIVGVFNQLTRED